MYLVCILFITISGKGQKKEKAKNSDLKKKVDAGLQVECKINTINNLIGNYKWTLITCKMLLVFFALC